MEKFVDVKMKDFLKVFTEKYNMLYDSEDKIEGYEENIDRFEAFVNEYKEFVGEFINYRGDYLTSDREVSAFMFAVDSVVLNILPDKSITINEMKEYGYRYAEMLPLQMEKALELYDNDICVYLLYSDNTEGQAECREDIQKHDGIYGVELKDWLIYNNRN